MWMDCAVIRICYENFSAATHDVTGLHGKAERCARGVTLYLLPGLTTGQRRAVIRRLRQEASRSCGPPLPLPQLAVAVGLDRVRTAARIAGAIVRLHPVVTLLPGAFMVAVMALFVITSYEGLDGAQQSRGGLAEAASAGGGGSLQGVGARPAPVRVAEVRVGPAAGRGARTGHAGRKGPRGRIATRAVVPPSAWVCPRVMPGPAVPRPSGG
jgi:hypothetical protein